MKRRLLSLLLVCVMLCTMLPVSALAEGGEDVPASETAEPTVAAPAEAEAKTEAASEPAITAGPETESVPEAPAGPETVTEAEAPVEPAQDEVLADEPVAVAAALDEPVPVAEASPAAASLDLSTVRLSASFQEKNTSFPDSPIKTNMARVSIFSGTWIKWEPGRFKVTVQAPGGDFVPVETMPAGTNSTTGAWQLESPKKGVYTVQVEPAEGAEDVTGAATTTFTLYEVTFHATQNAGGKFDNGQGTYIGYSVSGSAFSSFNLPKVEPPAGKDFIGWSTQENHTDDDDTIPVMLVDSLLDKADYTGKLYAAYGTNLYAEVELNPNPVEITVQKGYIPEQNGKTVAVKNTGNQEITLKLSGTPVHFDVQMGELTVPGGESRNITVLPKADLSTGTYEETLLIWSGRSVKTTVKLRLTVEPTTVTVRPGILTKEYGQALNAGFLQNVETSLEASVGGQAPSYEELVAKGLRLDSSGFTSTASVGNYEIYNNGSSDLGGYQIKVEGGSVQVNPATPEGTANAGGVRVGDTLDKAALTGGFTNQYTRAAVDGVLSWDRAEENPVVGSAPRTVKMDWTFTPTDGDNYKTVKGTADIVVSDKETTELSVKGATSFTYDGQDHPLQVVSNRPEGEGGPILVQYKLQDQEDTALMEQSPKNAGTYVVRASVGESDNYAAASYDFTMTIEKLTLSISYSYSGKVYDGTTQVNGGVTLRPLNLVKGDSVTVTYSGMFDDKNAGSRNVSITLDGLEGPAAGDYQLPESRTYHTTAMIASATVTLTINDGVTKEYGDTMAFQAGQFTAQGLVAGETVADLNAEFSCLGAASDARVGSYSVSAVLRNGNYKLTKTAVGNMAVIKATPVPRGLVLAGQGKKGGTLKNVTITGEFVNPHNNSMAVPGSLVWANPDTQLPNEDRCEAEWTFQLGDTENYNQPQGAKITVKLVDKTPIPLWADTQFTDFNGQPQAFTNYRVEPVEGDASFRPENISVRLEYRIHEDFLHESADISLMSVGREWTDEKPQDAGTYDVRITALAGSYAENYADNSVQAHLEIQPVAPDASKVPAQVTVPENSGLTDVAKLLTPKPAGLDGKELEGGYTWETPGLTVTQDGAQFRWFFLSPDSNYTSVSGTVTVFLTPDERVIQGRIYNLPASWGYEDYAVVNVKDSGLKEGEIVVFYKRDTNGEFTDPVSAPVTVTGEQLTVPLDGDALETNGGVLQARITSSQKHMGSVLSYGTEPTLTLLEDGIACDDGELNLPAGGKCQVSVALQGEGYTIQSVTYGLQQTGNTFTVTKNTDAWSGSLESKMGGEAVLTATVTLNHPDPVKAAAGETVVLTVQAKVVCKGVVKDKVQSNPELSGTLTGGSSLQDSVMTPEEIAKAEESGNVVDVVLSVQAVHESAVAADAYIVKEACGDTYTVGQYMEIDLTKYTYTASGSTSEEEEITETKKPLTIQVSVPAALAETLGTLFDKDFAVVRVHNGVSTILSDLDSDPRTVTFESDQFSTYALVYKDSDNVGSLTVTNKVTGNKGELEKLFNYVLTVEYPEAEVYGGYVLNGEISGLTFTDGSASFSLKGGESVTVKDLMAGGVFTVAQQAEKDYYTTQTGTTGTVTKDVESKADFTNERNIYTVTFDANGGKLTGGSKATTGPDGKLGSLPKATKEGEYFAGWYTAKTGGTKVSVNTVYSGDTTLYARWSKTPVTGDENNIVLWGVLLGVSAVALCAGAVILLRKKKKK